MQELRNVSKHYHEATSDSTCDKKGLGFNLDDRFSCLSLKLSLDSWKGYFGHSGCTTINYFEDSKLVKEGIVRYLELNRTQVFNWIADQIELSLREFREEAIKEAKRDLEEVSKEI